MSPVPLGILAQGGLPAPVSIDYLVIAGGGSGGGGNNYYAGAGGGGAGGYRTSVGTTGGGGPTESALTRTLNSYTVTVGAGGAPNGGRGSSSVFGPISTVGGGFGGWDPDQGGSSGGSGGGGGWYYSGPPPGGAGTVNQGFAGQSGGAGAGGGAASTGSDWNNPGIGIYSNITGTSVPRAGGGKGSPSYEQRTGRTIYGGGGNNYNPSDGVANTGSGGGGTSNTGGAKTGGSGFVVLRYGSQFKELTVGPGLTYTFTDNGTHKIYQFTAGTGTVSW